MKSDTGTLYEIVSFDNSDENFTGNPSLLAVNLSRATARKMLKAYREINHDEGFQFRYVMIRGH